MGNRVDKSSCQYCCCFLRHCRFIQACNDQSVAVLSTRQSGISRQLSEYCVSQTVQHGKVTFTGNECEAGVWQCAVEASTHRCGRDGYITQPVPKAYTMWNLSQWESPGLAQQGHVMNDTPGTATHSL